MFLHVVKFEKKLQRLHIISLHTQRDVVTTEHFTLSEKNALIRVPERSQQDLLRGIEEVRCPINTSSSLQRYTNQINNTAYIVCLPPIT